MDTPLVASHIAESANAAAILEEAKQKAHQSQINAAVEEGFRAFIASESFTNAIGNSIRTTVNGKIDKIDKKIDSHNEKHEKDMDRMMPVIEAYESARDDLATAQKGGKVILWLAATVTALGGAYLVLRMIFFKY